MGGMVDLGRGLAVGVWLVTEAAITPKNINRPNPAYINIFGSGFHPAGSFLSRASYHVSAMSFGYGFGSGFSGWVFGFGSMLGLL